MDKLNEYNDVTSRLIAETVACCPTTWDRGVLSIQSDGIQMTYQLKNADHPDEAVISESLKDLIDELYVRMARRGDAWAEAAATWWRDGDSCKFNVEYVYPKSKKAPWWKISAKHA
ncbi:hypothetical protein [Thermomonas fusca]